MDIFLANFWWMIPNLALAGIGFLFALFYLHAKSNLLRIPLFVLWLLFMPNTIYLISDLQHLPAQMVKADLIGDLALIAQYGILALLGILTYFAAMMPVEAFFKKKSKRANYNYIFILVNFAVGFAVVLGKVERTHSWYVFTQPLRAVHDILHVLTTPVLFISVIIAGLLFNLIYFGLKSKVPELK